MIYYFGNYLADGSTHGDSSAINASNHIQADYLIKVYSSFIYDSNLNFYLAFTKLATDLRTDQEIIIELKKYWQSIHNIIIDDKRIRIWTSKYESRIGTKITDYGSLEISDARSIVKILYNKLMEKITFLLLRSKSPSLIWKFLLGYLEGDGSIHTSRVGRFYIKFAANKDNVGLLTKLLDIVDVGYHISNAGNGRNIYIEIEEALKHFNYYASEIFKYYPKRRKIFVIRFFKNPSVHYLTGYRNSINQPSVEKFLNENIKNNNTIMNEIKILEQELHGYGLKILDFVNELNEYGKYLPVRTK